MSLFFVQKMLVDPPFKSLIFAAQQFITPGTNAGYVLPVLVFFEMRHTQKERIMRSVCARGRRSFSFARSLSASDIESMMNGEKKSAHNFESLSRFFFPSREGRGMPRVAPDHDAPSRVLDRLGFAAFVLDFPDVCRKKKEKKRRRGGGARERVSFFERERERDALVDPQCHCVFGAAVVSLIFSKIGL